MKESTREICVLALSSDASIPEAQRKKLIHLLNNPNALNEQNNESAFLKSITKAARIYGLNPRTISRLISKGELKAHRVTPHSVRIDIRDLENLRADKVKTEQERDFRGRFIKD